MNEQRPGLLIRPHPDDPHLTERVAGVNERGETVETGVVVERALTLYLNAQEIVTTMTINDYPDYLALGYLLNQNMLKPGDAVTGVDYDEDLSVVVVRTDGETNFEDKLKKRTQTSGCAQGTAFGDLLEARPDRLRATQHRRIAASWWSHPSRSRTPCNGRCGSAGSRRCSASGWPRSGNRASGRWIRQK